MKKFIVFLTTILLSTCLLLSCYSGKNEEICLLESVTSDGEKYNYEYDDQNRITKESNYDKSGNLQSEKIFIYNGNDLVRIEGFNVTKKEYEKNGNNIIVYATAKDNMFRYKETFQLNNDGDIIKKELYDNNGELLRTMEYTYDQSGKMVKETFRNKKGEYNYEYDNKNAPFIHCNTPKWWMQDEGCSTKNNIIKVTEKEEEEDTDKHVHECVYEYDDVGYPIKQIVYNDGEKGKIVEYRYRNASHSSDNSGR